MLKANDCDRCGQDRGTDGVTTVELDRRPNGTIEFMHIKECRPCALKQAHEEMSR